MRSPPTRRDDPVGDTVIAGHHAEQTLVVAEAQQQGGDALDLHSGELDVRVVAGGI